MKSISVPGFMVRSQEWEKVSILGQCPGVEGSKPGVGRGTNVRGCVLVQCAGVEGLKPGEGESRAAALWVSIIIIYI